MFMFFSERSVMQTVKFEFSFGSKLMQIQIIRER